MREQQEMVRAFRAKFGLPETKRLADEFSVQAGDTGKVSHGLKVIGADLLPKAQSLIPDAVRFQRGTDDRLVCAQQILECAARAVIGLGAKREDTTAAWLARLVYAALETAELYDISMEDVFAEVHRSNMTRARPPDDPMMLAQNEGFESPDVPAAIERGRNGGDQK